MNGPLSILSLIFSLLLTACSSEQVDVMFECASPSGSKIATLLKTSTGERPGDQEMKLNVRPADATLKESMASFSFRHGYDAIIRWSDDHNLIVTHPRDSAITQQEPVVFGSSQTFDANDPIRIIYQEESSTHGHFMVEKRCFNRVEN